jgi:hypothetical protein
VQPVEITVVGPSARLAQATSTAIELDTMET